MKGSREALEGRLWKCGAGALALLMIGSAVHLTEALSWANRGGMAFFLALGLVALQIALVTLSLVNHYDERPQVKYAVRLLMVLLLILEVTGNIAAGGALA